ncbi:hypothetical protein [uncultured Pelagibacterium sp.]|uniref:hypothetical protein n=1 Tax=uncultured Pelagibacterium sp. TaxID=1159875 RepID=UPI0030DA1184
MERTIVLAVAVLIFTAPAFGQRIELDGGNSGSTGSGLLGIETERNIDGGLTIEVGPDGVGIEADGEATLGPDDSAPTIGGGVSLGSDGQTQEAVEKAAVKDEVAATPGAAVLPEADANGENCTDSAAFAAQLKAFLEEESSETLAYIQRVDVNVCGYDGSDALLARLNTIEGVWDGLDHMEIEPESIVSARWTDDQGLVVYIETPEIAD